MRCLSVPSSPYRLSLAWWSDFTIFAILIIFGLIKGLIAPFFIISIIFALIRCLIAPSSMYRLSLPWSEVWLHLFPNIHYLCPDQRSDCTFFPISIIFGLIRGLIAPSSLYPLSLAWSISNLSTSLPVTSQLEGRQVPWPGVHSSLLWPRLRPHGWPRVTNATMVMSNLLSHFLITYPACVWASSLCDQVLSLY